ncbi:nuclear transport factor 2 family protein [Microcella sp.]|uniref:nuclear transport factor 2 family protein n=1 Tax=Microcella sp. TaxID=1913979 RepID=UPI0025681F82|nr:nuclear transport factor 2 family protein [Microcella sp.]MBX9472396.1 nuclear transport factor 2 family protein [Microcella sp.]
MSLEVFQSYLQGIIDRDWDQVTATLAAGVHREGYDGPQDSTDGRDNYIQFLDRVMTPIEGFGYDVHRIASTENGKVGLIEVTSRYVENGEELGYRMAYVITVDDNDLIDNIEIYWKTPTKRLSVDTVYDRTAG